MHSERRKLYKVWRRIIRMTTDPTHRDYIHSILGTRINPNWVISFDYFQHDIDKPPTLTSYFVRKDRRYGFFKENCQWVTKEYFPYFRARKVKYNGEILTVRQIADRLNLDPEPIRTRLWKYDLWDTELNEDLVTPKETAKKITYQNKTYSFSKASKVFKIDQELLYFRRRLGYTDKELIEGREK